MEDNISHEDLDDPKAVEKVIVDFTLAASPRTDFAKDLALQSDTLVAAGNGSNMKIAAAGRSQIHDVNPFLLSIKPDWNSRLHSQPDNRLHVLELALSIAEIGVQEPVTVYGEDDKLWITNGHCRYLAVMHVINVMGVELRTIPIKFEGKYASEAERIATQIVRNSGKPLNPLEMARVCKRLHSMGWSPSKIGKLAGKSRGRIVQLLQLHASTSPEIEDMINNGEVSPSFVGRVLNATENMHEAEVVLHQAVKEAKKAGKLRASEKHLPVPLEDLNRKGGRSRPSGDQVLEGSAVEVSVVPDFPPAPAPASGSLRNPPANASRPAATVPDPKKRAAKEIFRRASVHEGDEVVTITLKSADYVQLRELLGIPA
jgi:ParB-like chromosome segregation protein Spo0J